MSFLKKALLICTIMMLVVLASGHADTVMAADVSSQISVSSPTNVQLLYDKSTGAYTATATVTVTGTDVPLTDTVTLTAESDDEGTSVQLGGGTEVALTGDQLTSAVDVQLVIAVDADGLSTGLHTGGYRLVLSAEKGEEPEPVAGLYDADGALLCTWEDSGIDVETDYTSSTYKTNTASPYYVLKNTYTTTTKVVLPDSVAKIGNYSFYSCNGLTSVTIPNSVTKIGKYAFYSCNGLTSVIIPDNVTSIGFGAFYQCTSLTSVVIPDNVTSIKGYSFNMCIRLISVTIPYSVKSIEEYAFFNCKSLTTINFNGTMEQWSTITKGTSWNYNCPSTMQIICTDGTTSP